MLDTQRAALKAAGAGRVFAEKVAGAKTDRRQLQGAIESLGAGDLLLVTGLDRLARSRRDQLNVLATRIPVPNEKMEWDAGNPTGHGIIFLQIGTTKDYVAPGGCDGSDTGTRCRL